MQSCSVPPIYLGRYLLLVLARNTYLGSERYYEESGSGCTKWLHNACVRVRAPGPPPTTTTRQTRLVASHLCVRYASPPGREVFARPP